VRFLADLHIHSYLSRATSKDLTLEQLHRWAQRKGISVVGTGDFTHPRWLAELREKLVPAGDGLFALREDLARAADAAVPPACRAPVRFLLSVEVSSIYKRDGKVRKVHNLAYAPDLESAARIAARLARIGNIASDGRPILGLDSRDFLEIVLESSPDSYLVPAHIWTPWFSALGAQSGFDAIADCYADLAGEVFAVETGLSSDPAMNWRLSALDRYALVSNSDAHSPEKLGREANLFDCDLSYFALRDALRGRREGFRGTVEFFPEEGKYHLAGHRHCGVALAPREADAAGGLCPTCGKRLTAGVLGRVDALADRPEGARPEGAKPFRSLIPLTELIGELVDAGPGSARVEREYEKLLARVGAELAVLGDLPVEDLGREGPPLFGEAIQRMRAGQVQLRAGFDGEYGVVRVFDAEERRRLLAQRSFAFPALAPSPSPAPALPPPGPPPRASEPVAQLPLLAVPDLNAEQAQAVDHPGGPLLVLAGPGTGKTRVVTHRIARLVREGVSPRAITAITFTRRAAGELRERLGSLLGPAAESIEALTFHALGLSLLRAFPEAAALSPGFEVLDEAARSEAIAAAAKEAGLAPPGKVASAIGLAKAGLLGPERCAPGIAPVYAAYQRALEARGAIDFDDLVVRAVRLLESCPEALASAQERCRFLFVDEYQDVNPAQERLVLLLAPPGPQTEICAVGDPDQAIYGFRGSDPACVHRFTAHYPGAAVVALRMNYRCPAAVVHAATQVIERAPGRAARPLDPLAPASPPVERICLASELEEADFIAREIERAVGGTSLGSIHAGRAGREDEAPLAFHDVAVLFRTSAQADAIGVALDRGGIPYQRAGDDALTARPDVAALIAGLRAAEAGRLPVADLIARLTPAEAGARLREAAELLATLAVPFGRDAAAFLAALPLWQAGDAGLAPQKVALLTLHAAKGLEFPLVFIAGCQDGLLPLRFPGRPPADLEEERRLLYVGMTRARRRLVLTEARRRLVQGQVVEHGPCPFLEGLPSFLVSTSRRPAVRRRAAQQIPLL
jgi:uncharacterized protein (TIGR00375 family)